MTYDFVKIRFELNREFHLLRNQEKVEKGLESIVDTINFDIEHSLMRPFSHNVISCALRYISSASNQKVALWIMDQIPAIESLYKICRPTPPESHGDRRSR